jgi:hypothetical protein
VIPSSSVQEVASRGRDQNSHDVGGVKVKFLRFGNRLPQMPTFVNRDARLHAGERAIERPGDGVGQLHQVGLRDVADDEHRLT